MFFPSEWIQLVVLYTFAGIGFSVVVKSSYRYVIFSMMLFFEYRIPKVYFFLERFFQYKKTDLLDETRNYYESIKRRFEKEVEDNIKDPVIKKRMLESHKRVNELIENSRNIDMTMFKQKVNEYLDEFYKMIDELR